MHDRRDLERVRTADEEFELVLPLTGLGAVDHPTHVVVLRGDQNEFIADLDDTLLHDDLAARALRDPTDSISLGHLADLLNRVGSATVQSIDRL